MRIKNSGKLVTWFLFFWLSVTLIVSPAHAAKNLNDIISPDDELSKKLPQSQVFSGIQYSLSKNYNYHFNASTKLDPKTGDVHFEFVSPVYEFRATLDSALRLKKAEYITKDKNAINRGGHDRRVITLDPETKERLTIEFFLHGESVEIKELDYDYFTLYLGVAHITMQVLLLNGLKDFHCPVILPDKAWRLGVDFKLIKCSDPQNLAPQYKFPEKLLKKFKSNNQYLVYVAKLKGALGLFYKRKYYLVYKAEKPYEFVAYWGGDPKRVEFLFTETTAKGEAETKAGSEAGTKTKPKATTETETKVR